MTTAPSFNHVSLTILALPTAAMTISALETSSSMFCVREWTIVTVAFRCKSKNDTGNPTRFERPMTAAFLPSMSTPDRSINSKQPNGVHGTLNGIDCNCFQYPCFPPCVPVNASRATFSGCNPSTSFDGVTACKMASSSMWAGNGNWIRIPWTSSLPFSSWTVSSSVCCETSASKSYPKLAIPTWSHAFFFMLTYVWESRRLPTRTTAKPGTVKPSNFRPSISACNSFRIVAAIAFPSIIFSGGTTLPLAVV
mmetsp:Transcript_27360/g.65632  ORF Transcript_27360/g.65632 Transcript_27360/m.65632 type:complete len:252 (-) Transcript_27360:271-1026(-)